MTSSDYKAKTLSDDMERKIKIMIENDIPQRINITGLGRRYISQKMIDDLKKEGGILPLLPALLAMLVSAAPAITAATGVIASTAAAASAIASLVKNSRETYNASKNNEIISSGGKGLYINSYQIGDLISSTRDDSIKLDKKELNNLYHFLKSKNFKNKNIKNVELNIERSYELKGLTYNPPPHFSIFNSTFFIFLFLKFLDFKK